MAGIVVEASYHGRHESDMVRVDRRVSLPWTTGDREGDWWLGDQTTSQQRDLYISNDIQRIVVHSLTQTQAEAIVDRLQAERPVTWAALECVLDELVESWRTPLPKIPDVRTPWETVQLVSPPYLDHPQVDADIRAAGWSRLRRLNWVHGIPLRYLRLTAIRRGLTQPDDADECRAWQWILRLAEGASATSIASTDGVDVSTVIAAVQRAGWPATQATEGTTPGSVELITPTDPEPSSRDALGQSHLSDPCDRTEAERLLAPGQVVDRVVAAMRSRGLTTSAIARDIGLPHRTIDRMLSSRALTPSWRSVFAQVLQIDLDTGGDPPPVVPSVAIGRTGHGTAPWIDPRVLHTDPTEPMQASQILADIRKSGTTSFDPTITSNWYGGIFAVLGERERRARMDVLVAHVLKQMDIVTRERRRAFISSCLKRAIKNLAKRRYLTITGDLVGLSDAMSEADLRKLATKPMESWEDSERRMAGRYAGAAFDGDSDADNDSLPETPDASDEVVETESDEQPAGPDSQAERWSARIPADIATRLPLERAGVKESSTSSSVAGDPQLELRLPPLHKRESEAPAPPQMPATAEDMDPASHQRDGMALLSQLLSSHDGSSGASSGRVLPTEASPAQTEPASPIDRSARGDPAVSASATDRLSRIADALAGCGIPVIWSTRADTAWIGTTGPYGVQVTATRTRLRIAIQFPTADVGRVLRHAGNLWVMVPCAWFDTGPAITRIWSLPYGDDQVARAIADDLEFLDMATAT